MAACQENAELRGSLLERFGFEVEEVRPAPVAAGRCRAAGPPLPRQARCAPPAAAHAAGAGESGRRGGRVRAERAERRRCGWRRTT